MFLTVMLPVIKVGRARAHKIKKKFVCKRNCCIERGGEGITGGHKYQFSMRGRSLHFTNRPGPHLFSKRPEPFLKPKTDN